MYVTINIGTIIVFFYNIWWSIDLDRFPQDIENNIGEKEDIKKKKLYQKYKDRATLMLDACSMLLYCLFLARWKKVLVIWEQKSKASTAVEVHALDQTVAIKLCYRIYNRYI
ncbi:hypothetical protein ACJX0J_038217 [Zea mays]